MTKLAAALLCLVACQAKDGAKYDIGGGGGGGGGGGMGGVDAGLGSGSGSGGDVVAGEVCLLTDVRQPDLCATTGAGGYIVMLDGHTATTNADGTFLIDSPTSSNLMWIVTGTDIETSLMSYSAVHRIPVLKQQDYLDLANENSVLAQSTYGDLFVHVTSMTTGTSEAAVAASTAPLATYATLFDGTTATTWTQTGTGTFGMVWIPGLAMGPVSATLTPSGGTAVVVSAIPIGDQTLTWVTLDLP